MNMFATLSVLVLLACVQTVLGIAPCVEICKDNGLSGVRLIGCIKQLCHRTPRYNTYKSGDDKGKFTNIVAKWPGSTHDSFIFRNSDVGIHLDQNHRGFDVDGLLLGDSGYACKPYLMTPYLRPSTRQQERYNSAQSRTRSVIERTFGRWKRRFHLLHSEIRLTPDRVCKVIVACAILFNFAILQKEPMVDDREIEDVDVGQDLGHQNGMNIRNLIATTYF